MKKLFKILKYTMFTIITLTLLLVVATVLYMRQDQFGKAVTGDRLERMKQSKHYKDGAFANLSFTPDLSEGYTMPGILYDFFFKRAPRSKPTDTIPSVQTDLHNLPADSNVLVWFGHSSYFMQINGVKILVDPVFSGNASPVPGTTKAYIGTNNYGVADMPDVDYLLISHDHYDHLDYKTIKELKPKVGKVICGLGVGAYFEQWGYDRADVSEHDWDETLSIKNGLKLHTLTARHFSGRTFKRNTTLWLAFLLESPQQKIFIGGDGGYDTHFAAIGERFGEIDLAILENGQYNVAWQAIHCLPHEVIKAAQDLHAKRVMPVHSSKFSLALHDWDEPLNEVSRLAAAQHVPLVTPMIGQPVNLNDEQQSFTEWWRGVE